jgi:CheY-like chemotaxis protein
MPTRVLAFESEPAFARELDTQFRALGCEVTVVDDVNLGLQAASANKPDLILLTIELPRMSGYSVCNRIKRDADLKEIPLIILSSESTDQTFEQHKRLGTRAQDYVRKPVTFPQLLEHVQKLVTLSAPVSISPDDDGIVIDDEVELSEDGLVSVRPSMGSLSPSLRPIDADIDDFAEHAFGAMLDAPASSPPSQSPATASESRRSGARTPSAIPASPRVPSGLLGQPGSLDSDRAADESKRLRSLLEEKEGLLAEAQGELKELRRSSRASLSDSAEVEALRRELQETKARLGTTGKPSIGPSAREFLDLREQLNRKDKELLELRDQITRKDKDLLNLRDTSLGFEREKADLADRVEELTRQFSELQKVADAAKNDKEAAAKRADDHKRKSEKIAGQLEEKTAELEKAVARHSAQLAERDAERARLVSEHAATLEAARTEFVRAIAEAEQEGRVALEQAVAEARSSAEAHKRQELEAERQRANEEKTAALSSLEQRISRELADERAAALDKLQAEKADLESQRDVRIAQLQSEIDRLGAELQHANQRVGEREQSIASLEAAMHGARGDLEQGNRTIAIRDERIATLENELGLQRNETLSTLESLSAERQRLAQALDKWNDDQLSLEKIKDALAAALLHVESIEQRTLE